ncbi:hypothetical protein K469DRAFT_686877 [Zopfia rhizophila CBS 207.26]|uniref:Uncharacterized protein n=1 Tax=Zopfia rhizophila CBS 207.26 TaxID=1314779 RepID=A0A6A6E6T2_9PEZI|nr:hypothetical protein K469DRAFT_686877 [Zopfia rhizophila CBS 207.26]
MGNREKNSKSTPSSRRRDKHQGRRRWDAYTHAQIAEIKRDYPRYVYPVLYAERMWCQRHKGKPFPIMQLPPKIRLQIYAYRLVQKQPIEIWPHLKDNTQYGANIHRAPHFGLYQWLHLPLSLIRVCSTIHREASEVFYRLNQFRFSGING